jgi:ankyrin repeat protein
MIRRMLPAAIAACFAMAQSDAPKEPLCRAARIGDIEQARALLAQGADPNMRDENGDTLLMQVAVAHIHVNLPVPKEIKRDYEGLARLLLDKGADVNATNPTGATALLMAVDGSASEYRVIGADDGVARLLIERGANVNARDNDGWSPVLRLANLFASQSALIELLAAKGGDINAHLKDGRTALMLAARLGADYRVKTLIAKGGDVNAQDQSGDTALMIAATIRWDESSINIMKMLIAKGANLNATDSQGRTAADWAAQGGYLDRAKMLLESGTKVVDRSAFIKNALDHALSRAIADGDLAKAKSL